MRARKTRHRIRIIDIICKALSHPSIYEVLEHKKKREELLALYLYPKLLSVLRVVHRKLTPEVSSKRIREKAIDSVVWEGHPRQVIRHLQVFGVNHRPDFEIRVADMLIAVEVKVGKTGQAIREGLGQSVVYARKYDFVIYLFADTSKTRALKNSTKKKRERKIIDDFWAFHNTRLVIV